MIIAVTGHRSEDCGKPEEQVRASLREAFLDAKPSTVIVGMANGVDLWAGDEALDLGMEVWAAKPWKGHKSRRDDVVIYAKVIDGASRVIDVDDSLSYPGPWVYQKRNEWMVDHATHVLAYWSGKMSGGTYNCLKYAMKTETPIRNIYGHEAKA